MLRKVNILMLLAAFVGVVCTAPCAALAQPDQNQKAVVGIEEKLGDILPADLIFAAEDGSPVTLGELIDKPTILNLVYYNCPSICGPLLNSLRDTIELMEIDPGRDYDILTISFNERDTPDLAARKRENFLNLMEREMPPESWRFITGARENIETLTDAVGFYYERVEKGGSLDFNHPATLIILSPERKINGYIRGQTFIPADVTLALIEAKAGKIRQTRSSVGKRGLLSFCYTYDPVQQKRILSITRVGALATLSLLGVFIVLVLILKKGKPAAVSSATPAASASNESETTGTKT
jgi:protein SCO1/2